MRRWRRPCSPSRQDWPGVLTCRPAGPSPFVGPPLATRSLDPAPPFRLEADATTRARAVDCLADAVYYEAGGEPREGREAVAQVVLNRVRHPSYPQVGLRRGVRGLHPGDRLPVHVHLRRVAPPHARRGRLARRGGGGERRSGRLRVAVGGRLDPLPCGAGAPGVERGPDAHPPHRRAPILPPARRPGIGDSARRRPMQAQSRRQDGPRSWRGSPTPARSLPAGLDS